MADFPIYRLVKGSTLTFTDMDGNLEWLSRTMSASVVTITGSTYLAGNLTVSDGITGSLFGTSSWAVSASNAINAANAISASYVSGSGAIVTNLSSSRDARINGLTIGKGNNSLFGNTAIGENVLRAVTSGNYNALVGRSVGYNITTANYNTSLGNAALFENISSDGNTAIGMQALKNTTGQYNTALGTLAGANITTGQYNTILGAYGFSGGGITTGNYNTVVGSQITGLTSTLSNNIILSDGQGNIKYRWDGVQNNISGGLYVTGGPITGSNALFTGTITSQTLIVQTVTSSIVYSSGSNIFGNKLTDTHQFTGSILAPSITGSLYGTSSWAENALSSSYPIAVTGSTLYSVNPLAGPPKKNATVQSIFLGDGAGYRSDFADYSVFLGPSAGAYATSASISVFIGSTAGLDATNVASSVFIGQGTGDSAARASYSNFIGEAAGQRAISASYSNFIGYNSGYRARFASHSILIGNWAGSTTSTVNSIGPNNIIIGNNISFVDDRRDSINIGAIIFATGSYNQGLIGSDPFKGTSNGRVGINQINPTSSLDVSGSGRFTNGLTVTGSILVTGSVSASAFAKSGGTSAQFLKADGSVDSSVYYLASNPNLYTSNAGTITSVTVSPGTGMSGGGTLTGAGGTLTLTNAAPDQTVVLTQGGTTVITGTYPNFTITSNDQYNGTVTSVGGTGTVSGISLSGTVSSTGNLTLGGTLAVLPSNFASQTANTVLAAPNGSVGVPTFRALVAADIPSLNYQASLSGTGFVKISGTSISYDNSTYTPTSRTLTINGTGYDLSTDRSWSVGTVTSVSGTGTVSGLTLTGTVSTSGNLTLGGTLSLTSLNVTTALGYTPYNATNPDGYVSNATDTYTATPKITNIITLSAAEYAAIGSPSTSVLYIII